MEEDDQALAELNQEIAEIRNAADAVRQLIRRPDVKAENIRQELDKVKDLFDRVNAALDRGSADADSLGWDTFFADANITRWQCGSLYNELKWLIHPPPRMATSPEQGECE